MNDSGAARGLFQIMPDLSPEDYAALRADIAKRGVQVPIEYDEAGNIIDGYNRERICIELGIKDWPRTVRTYASDAAKRTQARMLNLARRHLDQAAKRKLIEEELKENPQRSNRQVAAELGVSNVTVGAVRDHLVSTAQIEQSTKRLGKDGRLLRPSSKRRSAAAKTRSGVSKPDGVKQAQRSVDTTEKAWNAFKGICEEEGISSAMALGNLVQQVSTSGRLDGVAEHRKKREPVLTKEEREEQKAQAMKEYRAAKRERLEREAAEDKRPRLRDDGRDVIMYGVKMWPLDTLHEDAQRYGLRDYDFDQLFFATHQFLNWLEMFYRNIEAVGTRAHLLRTNQKFLMKFIERRLEGQSKEEMRTFIFLFQKLSDLYRANPKGECKPPFDWDRMFGGFDP
jgi:ParB-like chromosome segregation protein Spo0J